MIESTTPFFSYDYSYEIWPSYQVGPESTEWRRHQSGFSGVILLFKPSYNH